MFTFRGRVRDTDGHSRSEGSEKTERIGVFELTGLGADAATISAKRHRIEQIVLNGLTVYSFEGIIQNRYGPMAQLVRAPPCHGGGRGFESHSGRLYRIFSI